MRTRKHSGKTSKVGKAGKNEARRDGSRSSGESRNSQPTQTACPEGQAPHAAAKESSQRHTSPTQPRSTDDGTNVLSYEGTKAAAIASLSPSYPATPSGPWATRGAASTEGFEVGRPSVSKSSFKEGSHAAALPHESKGLVSRLRCKLANLCTVSDEGRTMRLVLATALTIVVVSVLVVLAVPWALAETNWNSRENASGGIGICDTVDCLNHEHELGMDRARSVDPCDDFSQFVCSAWVHDDTRISKTFDGQVVTKWALGLTKKYSAGKSENILKDHKVANRPRQMMALCLDARHDDTAGLRALKDLISTGELGFISPQRYVDHDSYAFLLQHLVVLSGKWLIPLWFRIEMPPIRRIENSRMVLISPEPLVLWYHRLHEIETASEGRYAEYVELYLQEIYDNGTAAPADYVRFLRQSSARVQATVFNKLSGSVGKVVIRDSIYQGKLSELSKFLPNWNTDDWIGALKAFLGDSDWHGGPISAGDKVHAASLKHLNAMTAVMANLTALELLYHTFWWVVQQLGSLTSNAIFNAFVAQHGDFGSTIQKLSCAYQVGITYNVLIADLHRRTWSEPQRAAVAKVVSNVRVAALQKLRNMALFNNSQHMDPVSKTEEGVKAFWPDARDSRTIPDLHDGAIDNTMGFFGHWLSSRRQWQRAMSNWLSRWLASEYYRVDVTALCRYNPANAMLSLATAALDSPLFYHNGTTGMLYGGLAFLYARCWFQALDVAVQIADLTTQHTTVAGEAGHAKNAVRCQRPDLDRDALYPFLPALEVAHALYTEEIKDSKDQSLRGMEIYSGEQVFFFTMCHSLCEEDARGSIWSPGCNAALREFRPFADAFNCSRGSAMNPDDKCSFLQG